MNNAVVELKGIVKTFAANTPDAMTLFDGFTLSVPERQFVSIIGSNGSGKTTLLNLVCGQINPDRGDILLHGETITKKEEFQRARSIGRVFQDPAKGSCPNLTILENMALADRKNQPYNLGLAINRRRLETYRGLLETCGMGLENRLDTRVGALSGGQRQALALILATMTDIRLLILDEHTAALDPKSSETIMALTDRYVREKRLTTLMVTHNLRHALHYGDRLCMMHEGTTVLDIAGEEKRQAKIEDLLTIFNRISIECGN